MKNKKGQSIVEIIFAIGVIAVVIVGIISLIVNVIGTKNAALKRKTATDLGEVVVEQLVQKKLMSPDQFWELSNIGETNVDGFDGYNYSVTFTKVTGDGCREEVNDCVNAKIDIVWDNGKNNLSITRFFSRRG